MTGFVWVIVGIAAVAALVRAYQGRQGLPVPPGKAPLPDERLAVPGEPGRVYLTVKGMLALLAGEPAEVPGERYIAPPSVTTPPVIIAYGTRQDILPLIQQEAGRAGIDWAILAGIAYQESGFRAGVRRYEPSYDARYCQGGEYRAYWDHCTILEASRRIAADPDGYTSPVPGQYAEKQAHSPVASSWGLFQFMYLTARAAGYGGAPEGLLNPVTNTRLACAHWKNLLRSYRTEALAVTAWNYPAAARRGETTDYTKKVLALITRFRTGWRPV